MSSGSGHVPHRFQQAAISCLRRQSAYAPHFADAAAFVRRPRGLRIRRRRDRARNVQPLRSGYRHHRLVDADFRWARARADDPAAGIKGQSLRSHHHVDRPFREAARHGGARRRRDRIPGKADLGQGALSAHPERRRQSAPVHQDQDLFRPGPPAQYEQHLYRARAPRRRRGRDPSAAVAARQGPLRGLARDAKEISMAKDKPGALEIKTFADHHVITQPNPLQKVLRRVGEKKDLDDPIARAEKALAGLSGEFKNWMAIEADRLSAAHAAILMEGFNDATREELFRAAHDIKGDAATFGYPSAGAAAESLCRIVEHAPELDKVPSDLIAHHINAIQAIVRERTKLDTAAMAGELSRQ